MWVCRSQIVTIKSRVCSDLWRLRLEHQVPMSREWKRRCNVTTRLASSISRRFTALNCRRLSIVCTLLWLGLITLVALGIRSADQPSPRSQFHLRLSFSSGALYESLSSSVLKRFFWSLIVFDISLVGSLKLRLLLMLLLIFSTTSYLYFSRSPLPLYLSSSFTCFDIIAFLHFLLMIVIRSGQKPNYLAKR